MKKYRLEKLVKGEKIIVPFGKLIWCDRNTLDLLREIQMNDNPTTPYRLVEKVNGVKTKGRWQTKYFTEENKYLNCKHKYTPGGAWGTCKYCGFDQLTSHNNFYHLDELNL